MWTRFKNRASSAWNSVKDVVADFVEEPAFFIDTVPTFFKNDIPDFFTETIPNYFTKSVPQQLIVVKDYNSMFDLPSIRLSMPNSFLLHLKRAAVFSFGDGASKDEQSDVYRRTFIYSAKEAGQGSSIRGFSNLISGNWQRLANPFNIINFGIGVVRATLLGVCDGLDRWAKGESNSFHIDKSSVVTQVFKGLFLAPLAIVTAVVGLPCKVLGEVTDGALNVAAKVVKGAIASVVGVIQLGGYGLKSIFRPSSTPVVGIRSSVPSPAVRRVNVSTPVLHEGKHASLSSPSSGLRVPAQGEKKSSPKSSSLPSAQRYAHPDQPTTPPSANRLASPSLLSLPPKKGKAVPSFNDISNAHKLRDESAQDGFKVVAMRRRSVARSKSTKNHPVDQSFSPSDEAAAHRNKLKHSGSELDLNTLTSDSTKRSTGDTKSIFNRVNQNKGNLSPPSAHLGRNFSSSTAEDVHAIDLPGRSATSPSANAAANPAKKYIYSAQDDVKEGKEGKPSDALRDRKVSMPGSVLTESEDPLAVIRGSAVGTNGSAGLFSHPQLAPMSLTSGELNREQKKPTVVIPENEDDVPAAKKGGWMSPTSNRR